MNSPRPPIYSQRLLTSFILASTSILITPLSLSPTIAYSTQSRSPKTSLVLRIPNPSFPKPFFFASLFCPSIFHSHSLPLDPFHSPVPLRCDSPTLFATSNFTNSLSPNFNFNNPDEVYFTIKPSAGIVATSFSAGDKVCIGTDKLLPIERFLPQPKAPAGAKPKKRGGAAGGRGGARGRGKFLDICRYMLES